MSSSSWRAAVRASRRPLRGLLSMRFILSAIKILPHPEGMATPRLSSRGLSPGPNALAAQSVIDRGFSPPAAGGDASIAPQRHALTPMGPGDRPRGDRGRGGASEKVDQIGRAHV